MATLDDVGPGQQLQTLISTLQSTNVQLGHLIKAVVAPAIATGSATGTTATAGGASALPATPVGYWIINLPGVGNVKIPYYGV